MNLRYTLLPHGIAPKRGTDLSAGIDLFAPEDIYLLPGTQAIVDIGVVFDLEELGPEWDISIQRRSSAAKKMIDIKLGLVDFDYRNKKDSLKVVVSREQDQFMGTIMTRYKQGYCIEFPYDAILQDGEDILVLSKWPMGDKLSPLIAKKGEAFAQIVVRKHYDGPIQLVSLDEWPDYSERGGFGSTDKKR